MSHKSFFSSSSYHETDRSSGSCIVEGKTYLSETSVPRDHPCHYCICYGGKIDCFWKQCAHIPDGCQVMAFQDTCNPSLYICGNFKWSQPIRSENEQCGGVCAIESYWFSQWHRLSHFLYRYSWKGTRGSNLRTPCSHSSAADIKCISIDESLHDKSTYRTNIGTKSATINSSVVFRPNLH